jgi:hypothetical protein
LQDYHLLSYKYLPQLNSTLKIEAMYASETSVDYQQNMRRYIPEDNACTSISFGFVMWITRVEQKSSSVVIDKSHNTVMYVKL